MRLIVIRSPPRRAYLTGNTRHARCHRQHQNTRNELIVSHTVVKYASPLPGCRYNVRTTEPRSVVRNRATPSNRASRTCRNLPGTRHGTQAQRRLLAVTLACGPSRAMSLKNSVPSVRASISAPDGTVNKITHGERRQVSRAMSIM